MAFTQPIDGRDIDPNSIERIHLAPNAVGSTELSNDAVESTHISDNAITTPKLAANSVPADVLAANAVDTATLAANAITSKHTITGAKFQTSALVERGVKIIDDAINMYDMATGKLLAALQAVSGVGDLFLDHIWLPDSVWIGKVGSDAVTRISSAFYDAYIELGLGSTAIKRAGSIIAMNDSVNNLILSIIGGPDITLTPNEIQLRGKVSHSQDTYFNGVNNYFTAIPTSLFRHGVKPLFIDANGRIFEWENAPSRVVTGSKSVAAFTIASGAVRNEVVNMSATANRTPDWADARFANGPGGASWLTCNVVSWTTNTVTVRIANTYSSSITLSGALNLSAAIFY